MYQEHFSITSIQSWQVKHFDCWLRKSLIGDCLKVLSKGHLYSRPLGRGMTVSALTNNSWIQVTAMQRHILCREKFYETCICYLQSWQIMLFHYCLGLKSTDTACFCVCVMSGLQWIKKEWIYFSKTGQLSENLSLVVCLDKRAVAWYRSLRDYGFNKESGC